MFWNIVSNGFQVLLEWKVWVIVFIYSAIMYWQNNLVTKRLMMSEILDGGESKSHTLQIFESFFVTKSIIDTVLAVIGIFLVIPILLGTHSLSSFSDLKPAFMTILIIILIITGARIILGKVSTTQSRVRGVGNNQFTFFICIFLISFIMHRLIAELPVSNIKSVFPSIWWSLLYVFISYVILLLFSFCLGLALIPFSENSKQYITNIFFTAGAFIMGIVYMRMYCYFILQRVSEVSIKWDAL